MEVERLILAYFEKNISKLESFSTLNVKTMDSCAEVYKCHGV